MTMRLGDVINRLSEFDSEDTIYAWTDQSEAMVAPEPDAGRLPQEVSNAGMKYFLEAGIARDFVEDWLGSLDEQPTPWAVCRRLIDYAIHDA